MNKIDEIYEALFFLNRSLVSDNNTKALDIINNYMPLKRHLFKSNEDCFDWKVPKKWTLKKAVLKDKNGNILIDSNDNILHSLIYGQTFKGQVSLKELSDHLFYIKELPDAIPYRTSYYDKNWGLCLSYNQFKNLSDEHYYVDIESDFSDGYLDIGEAVIKGKTDKEVILTSYICHPRQANDGLSGVISLMLLYDIMKNMNLKYTYRFFFFPETIGSLALISHNIIKAENIEFAIISTCVGYGKDLEYKKTFTNNHSLDNIIKEI